MQTNQTWRTSGKNNIPRVPVHERLFNAAPGSSGNKVLLRPEQKSIDWMMDLVSKFTKPGELVVDNCTGTSATAKPCMLLPQHRRFVGCAKDSDCFQEVLPSVVEVFPRQIKGTNSDIEGKEEVVASAKIFVEAMNCNDSRKRVGKWMVPPKLVPVQTVSVHITHFLGNFYKNVALYDRCRQIQLSQWSATRLGRFPSMELDSLLAQDGSAQVLSTKKSTVQHLSSGMGLLAARNIGKGDVVGYYYGLPAYADADSSTPQRGRRRSKVCDRGNFSKMTKEDARHGNR